MNQLQKFERKCNALTECHNYLGNVFKILNEVITISTILISAVITTFLPMINEETGIANSVLAFSITLLSVFTKAYKPAEKYEQHRAASEQYIALRSKITQKIISSSPDDKNNIDSIYEIITKFENLRKVSPFVDNKLYDKYLLRDYTYTPLTDVVSEENS